MNKFKLSDDGCWKRIYFNEKSYDLDLTEMDISIIEGSEYNQEKLSGTVLGVMADDETIKLFCEDYINSIWKKIK